MLSLRVSMYVYVDVLICGNHIFMCAGICACIIKKSMLDTIFNISQQSIFETKSLTDSTTFQLAGWSFQ